MEIDSIKLAKKLSNYSKVVMIVSKGYFIESKKDDYVGFNDIKLETISFKSNLGPSIIINARQIVQKYGIKNVIFFGASELKSLYFSFLGLDINLIVRHGTTKSRPKKDWFHRLIYSDVNYHVSICKHLENNVNYIIPFGQTTEAKLIYSSFEFNKPSHIRQEKLTLLHVGRIADAKGQIDAIKACKVLVDNNIDFVFNIVGGYDEPYKDEFTKFYNSCEYKDKINLVGFTNDVQSYIQKSDIFLFPSLGEGLSNAFLEAMTNNLVCFSYDNTSFPELKDIGLYFKMIENKNIDMLKNNLLEVVQNLELEKEKSLPNNNLISELFSVKKEMNSYMEILK
ncbi:MAG: lipopolysaccharide biosynthesis protein [Epsilonproteobacteria bacterium]|nr:MAG: lipopolysaccharide biosynthesis protein [Campylobacterota bacterium]